MARTWVLGGGGARGAAQAGVLLALFEAGVEPPARIVGASVGSLNGAALASYPSLAGAEMLRQIWLSDLARDVFKVQRRRVLVSRLRGRLSLLPSTPIRRLIDRTSRMTGATSFKDLRVPLLVLATDLSAGRPVILREGPLAPALLASTAIPGVYPAVHIDGRDYLDGGVVENTPISSAFEEGAREVLAIGLMAGAELTEPPSTWAEVIGRTLQLSLHHSMLSDFERLRHRARMTVLCPITPVDADRVASTGRLQEMMERARAATAGLLRGKGSRLFRRSEIHYMDIRG
ncbi:MAG: patatin-like phospholipase family protein [Candidatus Dormibacterales bacterium]